MADYPKLTFDRYLIDAPTLAEALRRAADKIEQLDATGNGEVVRVSVTYGDQAAVDVEYRIESQAEVRAIFDRIERPIGD